MVDYISYKINIEKNLEHICQSYPFLNSIDNANNLSLIESLYSLSVNKISVETESASSIIWESYNEIKTDAIYKFFEEIRYISDSINFAFKKWAKESITKFLWKFENINCYAKNVLSIGCGDGEELFFLRFKYPNAVIDAVDWRCTANLEDLSKLKINFFEQDIYTYLEENKDRYDLIFSNHVLEHSYNVEYLLGLINYSLRRDGFLASSLPLITQIHTEYYNFLKKVFYQKKTKLKQIEGALYDLGHPWKTNEFDLKETLIRNNFKEIKIFANSTKCLLHQNVEIRKFSNIANRMFFLNKIFFLPLRHLINKLFSNNINYWIMKIYLAFNRRIFFGDNRIANFVPEVFFFCRKNN
jgi:2-polyprenyl-3-methyl-5-hydroxy-6-metoxy-1,4-benzoquinol methylase